MVKHSTYKAGSNGYIIQVQLASKFLRADYVVEVHMQSYNNPTNRAAGQGGDCCDPQSGGNHSCTGGELCESYFIFCLRPLNTPPIQRGCDTPNITSEVAKRNVSIDFTQPIFLGITNPFYLNASGLWQVSVFTIANTVDTHNTHLQGVQLYVEVIDKDYTDLFIDTMQDDLIDVFAIDIVRIGTHTVVMSPGTYRYGRISVTTSVQCAESYHGDQCQFVNKCERDNIECSGRGVCVAEVDTYACDCEPGYTGMTCNMTHYCFGQNCSVRGACQNETFSYHCNCDLGFTGNDCEIDIDECEGQNCSENGHCVDGVYSYSCMCSPGFNGTNCEINVNECERQNCSGHGQCVDGVDSYLCTCNSGFTGSDCEIDINECERQNCSGNGHCEQGVNSYSCVCLPGFTGSDCEIDINECEDQSCSGNGECIDRVNFYSCECNVGFTGTNCETNIDDCVNQNCNGNGHCLDGVSSYRCDCQPGYTGDNCETFNYCAGVNCSGNGQCFNGENKFTCICYHGFTGKLCDILFQAESKLMLNYVTLCRHIS